MDSAQILRDEIHNIVDIARQAPSVHNAQPWRVELKTDAILVNIDRSVSLKHGDPTGRETYISLGIFSEAIVIAANASGLALKQANLGEAGSVLEFKYTRQKASPQIVSAIAAIKSRRSDRTVFKPINIAPSAIKKIESSSRLTGVSVKVITQSHIIQGVAELTAKGIGLALTSAAFRAELSNYLILPWSSKKRGISVASLRMPVLIALVEPWLIRRGIGLGSEQRVEKQRWLSASGIIIITTKGDVRIDWFQAGRAYLAAALAAEELGLAQATSAAAVEASSFHEDVEAMIGTQQRLQAAIRIGKGSRLRVNSPRLSVEDILV